MTLSPDKLAFIRGTDSAGVKTPSEKQQVAPPEKTIEFGESKEEASAQETRPQRRRGRGKSAIQEEPQASQILDRMLVPVTIRLQHRTAQALKRAALEQKLKHQKPDRVQEIGEEAISEWLLKSGYLD
jgi:hypothetical protein